MLELLFSSPARVKVLALLLLNPETSFYQREIGALTSLPIRAVQREVERLQTLGLLTSFTRGNQVHYQANRDFFLFRHYRTNPQEIASLFQVVERDLADAAITVLSADRRFTIAYNAALQAATAVMYSIGHHSTTFEFLKEAMGPGITSLADYFDDCRRKRNRADYAGAGYISVTGVEDLLREAKEFASQAQAWIQTYHPELQESKS